MNRKNSRIWLLTGSLRHFVVLVPLIFLSIGIVIVYFSLFASLTKARLWLQTYYPSFFLSIGSFAIAASAWVCFYFAPGASGSGHNLLRQLTPQNQPYFIRYYFNSKVIVVKMISFLLAAVGGSALGKEGPMVHIMTALWIAFNKNFSLFSVKSALIIGSSLGFGLVFANPWVGFLFALETFGLTILKKGLRWNILTLITLILTCWVADFVLQHHQALRIEKVLLLDRSYLIPTIVNVFLSTHLGWFFLKTITWGQQWMHTFSIKQKIFLPLGGGLLIVLIGFYGGIYTMGSGNEEVLTILHNQHPCLIKELLGRCINLVTAYTVGCSGGLVFPAFSLGAQLGNIVGSFYPTLDPRFFCLISMTVFLSLFTHAPFTAAVVVADITGCYNLLLPLCGASWGGAALKIFNDRLLNRPKIL